MRRRLTVRLAAAAGALAPDYARSRLLYAYFTGADDNRIVRFRLGEEPRPVLTGIPKASIHNGCRIAFGPDGMLYATTGTSVPNRAQDLGSLGGKILRLEPDGGIPADNPFPGSPVFTLGHRNVEGIAWDAAGRMFASEFGQSRFWVMTSNRDGRGHAGPDDDRILRFPAAQ